MLVAHSISYLPASINTILRYKSTYVNDLSFFLRLIFSRKTCPAMREAQRRKAHSMFYTPMTTFGSYTPTVSVIFCA